MLFVVSAFPCICLTSLRIFNYGGQSILAFVSRWIHILVSKYAKWIIIFYKQSILDSAALSLVTNYFVAGILLFFNKNRLDTALQYNIIATIAIATNHVSSITQLAAVQRKFNCMYDRIHIANFTNLASPANKYKKFVWSTHPAFLLKTTNTGQSPFLSRRGQKKKKRDYRTYVALSKKNKFQFQTGDLLD